MGKIQLLSDELLILVYSYLRATDLGAALQADKTIFSIRNISIAAMHLATNVLTYNQTNVLKSISEDVVQYLAPVMLRLHEINCIKAAISSEQPSHNLGYWISASWILSARKYFEASSTGQYTSRNKKPSKKTKKLNTNPRPTLCINSDITCQHGQLALVSGTRSKRRMMDAAAWRFLKQLYPQGKEFQCAQSSECQLCKAKDKLEHDLQSALALEASNRITPRKGGATSSSGTPAKTPPLALANLISRRSGIPSDCVPINSSIAASKQSLLSVFGDFDTDHLEDSEISEWMETLAVVDAAQHQQEQVSEQDNIADNTQITVGDNDMTSPVFVQPLVPGIYHLVPRDWLRQWRKSLTAGSTNFSSPSALLTNPPPLPPLDCTGMLCHSHGFLVVPPHVEEYLVGMRTSLLGGLGQYPGLMVEVLTAAEWDALQDWVHNLSGFSVRFSLDGENIAWNLPVCGKCDRFQYFDASHHL